jgi:hypothetical protein
MVENPPRSWALAASGGGGGAVTRYMSAGLPWNSFVDSNAD